MADLSVFIDESGDFGVYEKHAPYYLITLVLHDQSKSISEQVAYLKQHLAEAGFPKTHNIHSAPLIRRESDYISLPMADRRKLFRALFSFVRRSDIRYKTFLFRKKEFSTHDKMVSRISREISGYVKIHLEFFQSFDSVIVYYDNGQKEVTNIINAVFNALIDADIRKAKPSDYCLFQAADMICTLELIAEKLSNDNLTKSEMDFFMNVRNLKKNFLKPLERKSVDP
ncbi:DUF3800 domain-containing protein [Adlercreutzia sp. ZJ304]|uniref:DUF3800 domain-containing protein n=1 Tax=Adlercreutzia sp. ZJ304 TaxID=2709791 RepID=UPI0013EDAA97|nr:DUF3800 domain-containing protein [Adlercreutzia sp. ZJ304]